MKRTQNKPLYTKKVYFMYLCKCRALRTCKESPVTCSVKSWQWRHPVHCICAIVFDWCNIFPCCTMFFMIFSLKEGKYHRRILIWYIKNNFSENSLEISCYLLLHIFRWKQDFYFFDHCIPLCNILIKVHISIW